MFTCFVSYGVYSGRGGFAGRGGRGRGRGGLAQHNANHMMYATFETDAFQMQDDLEVAESVLRAPESPAPVHLHSVRPGEYRREALFIC